MTRNTYFTKADISIEYIINVNIPSNITQEVIMRFILLSALLILLSCASTSIQMIREAKPAISRSEVKKYKAMPPDAKEIATVSVSLRSNFGGVEANGQIKKMAASVGANGFRITRKQKSGSGFDAFGNSSGREYHIEAVVFYVSEEE